MTAVVGLDLSLTATGVARDDRVWTIQVPLPPNASEYQRVARLHKLVRQIDRDCDGADVVVIEGYGYHGKFSPGHSLGELGGAVRLVLFQRRIPFVIVVPQHLKRFATGSGKASKDKVFAAAVKHSSTDITTRDEADAYWLWLMGAVFYDFKPLTSISKVRQEVLGQIVWPALEERKVASG